MHVAVIFENIGGYHAARLRAAHQACLARNWKFTAIQITNAQAQHPWGDLTNIITFPLITIIERVSERGGMTATELQSSGPLLTAALEKLRPDAVAIPGWGFPYSRTALRWCRRRARAILMSESKFDDEPRQWWKEKLKAFLYVRQFQSALVGGASHRDYLAKLGVAPSKIFTGYDVVDNGHFQSGAAAARRDSATTRSRHPAIPHAPYFIVVTRFIGRKNVERLVRAYAIYHGQVGADAAWDLVICGSGVEEPNIRKTITELGLDARVHLPGFLPYGEIATWYGLAGALVHPALHEQWGLVLNEAAAAGLPILASKTVGAAAELVEDGKNGFLFDPNDTPAMAEALYKLAAASPAEREEMGRVSETIARKFAPETFGEGLLLATESAR